MASRKLLALVAEDTELGRWALTRALEAEGFDVRAASTWGEGSAWLAGADFSVVFVAVSSERGNAADIVGYVRQHHPGTHIVLLADQDDVGALRLACGPEAIIQPKPLDLQQIVRVAHTCSDPPAEALRA